MLSIVDCPDSLCADDRTNGDCPLIEPLSLTILLAWPTLGLFCAPTPIPRPTALAARSDVPPLNGRPLKLLGDILGCDTALGLSVRDVRAWERGVIFAFRSPSLEEVSATLT